MTCHELKEALKNYNTIKPSFFQKDPDFRERTELELLTEEVEELRATNRYLLLAQTYTGFVGQHLTKNEMDACWIISRQDDIQDDWKELIASL